jgi:hypothetical protein
VDNIYHYEVRINVEPGRKGKYMQEKCTVIVEFVSYKKWKLFIIKEVLTRIGLFKTAGKICRSFP